MIAGLARSKRGITLLASKNYLGGNVAIELLRTLPEAQTMLWYAWVFLVIAILAAVLGFGGIAATAASIAKILFLIFLVLFVVSLIAGRRTIV